MTLSKSSTQIYTICVSLNTYHIFCVKVAHKFTQYVHTFNLSFLLHGQDFRKPNFTPKKKTKDTKNTKNFSEKVKCMQFFHPIWKNLHLTEIFYTGTACDACDKLKVWLYSLYSTCMKLCIGISLSSLCINYDQSICLYLEMCNTTVIFLKSTICHCKH